MNEECCYPDCTGRETESQAGTGTCPRPSRETSAGQGMVEENPKSLRLYPEATLLVVLEVQSLPAGERSVPLTGMFI